MSKTEESHQQHDKPIKKPIKNLVLSGGSSKGFSYIGVIKALEENNLISEIETIATASIGSFFGLLIVLGFTSTEMSHILLDIDLDLLHNINSDSIINLVNNFGLDSGFNIETILCIMLEAKIPNKQGNLITFLDLWNFNKIKLIVMGSKLFAGHMEGITYDYINYPDMPVIKAIRISVSIPPVFKPLEGIDHHLMDGGIVNNYPIDLFIDQLDQTIGILCLTKYTRRKCENIYEVYRSIIGYLTSKSCHEKKEIYKDNTIVVESDLTSFEIFNLSTYTKNSLVNLGYQLSRQFLSLKGMTLDKPHNIPTKTIPTKTIPTKTIPTKPIDHQIILKKILERLTKPKPTRI